MARAQRLLPDDQRPLEELFRLHVLPLGSIHVAQVVEGLADVGVVRTERFLADRQRALVQPLRLAVLALLPRHDAQFVECKGVVCMIASEACLHQPLKLLCIDLGGRVISARVMILKGLVERDDVARLSRCRREPSERRQCEESDKSDRLAAPSRYHDLTDDVVSRTHNSRWKYGKKFPRQHRLKNSLAVPMTLGLFF